MQKLFKHTRALSVLAIVLASTLISAAQTSGVLDPNFGTGGKMTNTFGGTADASSARTVTVQPDGKILVEGGLVTNGVANLALSRYNPNGTLDATFGTGGVVTMPFDFPGNFDTAPAVILQPDGKIIAAGSTVTTPFAVFAMVRYNSNGTLDTTFGTGGTVTTSFGQVSASAYAAALQADGKIVLAGYANLNGGHDFALARYNSNGTLDTTFGTGGKVNTTFLGLAGQAFADAFSVAVQQDGRIVAAGYASMGPANSSTPTFDFAVTRYNSNGALDTTFGTGGKVTTDFGGPNDGAHAIAVQPDGRIVVAGAAGGFVNRGLDFALARYNSNGTLDAGFGTGGKAMTDFFGFSDNVSAVVLQGDGKIIAAGQSSSNVNGDFALARYNTNGTLDINFGTAGKVSTDFVGGEDSPTTVTLQPDGKIIAAGVAQINGNNQLALARYLNDSTAPSPTPMPTATPTPTPTPTPAPTPVPGQRTNVAAAANGAVASASSVYPGYPASSVINGDRRGVNWLAGGGWTSGTGVTPSWLEVDFAGSKTIDEMDVFTVQDSYANPVEPDLNQTFALYGATGFNVQYWDGVNWVTVPGGSISGNNKVWRKIAFSAITTTKIRVLVTASPDGYGRLTELEAWSGNGAAPTPTPTPTPGGMRANFVSLDTSQQGSWNGVYGRDGYAIANEATNLPSYAQVTFSNQANYTWSASTTDVRTLQKSNSSDRIASTWYSGSSFDIDINLTDGQTHQIALYCLDWDALNRNERIDVLDSETGAVLDTRNVSGFSNGEYLVWNIAGHVKIRVTNAGGLNAVASGLFFR